MSVSPDGHRPMEMEKRRGLSRYYFMPRPVKVLFLLGPVVSVILFVLHFFAIPVFGQLLASTPYYLALFTFLALNVFIGIGATHKLRMRPPAWYDYALTALFVGCLGYFLANSGEIGARNWDSPPGMGQLIPAIIVGVLAIEASRRIGGWPLVGVMVVAIIYPLVASELPGVFYGTSLTFSEEIGAFAFGANGILGLPARMFGDLVLGFYLFAGMVGGMGGGEFFLKLATGLAGRFRGGPAKVSVISSAFFGSLSGSIVANIVGTGAFTIPAMKRMGYSPEYAGAVETCASSGGDTMPPIMGGVAFLMCVIAGVDYADVLVAAFLPTVLHYFCLLIQVDSYAFRHGLRGLPRKECPPVGRTLLEGWIFIVVIFFLTFGLVYMRWGAITPIYAIALTYILQFMHWLGRWSHASVRGKLDSEMGFKVSARRAWERFVTSLSQAAGLINFGAATFLGVGFILVGLVKTGFAAGLTTYIVSLGGENIYTILLISCVICLVMGMAGLQRSAYLFLAVSMAPGLVMLGRLAPDLQATGGISLIGVHLFLIFYIGVGGFTPPVAIHAFIAAAIAGANPMKTAWVSCRLGIGLILLPFFFVLRPALLIIQSSIFDVLIQFAIVLLGLWFMASGLEAHIIGAGRLNTVGRAILILGGFLFAFPQWTMMVIGAMICVAGYAYVWLWNHQRKALVRAI